MKFSLPKCLFVVTMMTTSPKIISAQYNSGFSSNGVGRSSNSSSSSSSSSMSFNNNSTNWNSYTLYRERYGRLCDTTDPGALSMVIETNQAVSLFEGDFMDNRPAFGTFVVGRTASGLHQRALLKFDLNDKNLPPDAHVECVEIGLHVDDGGASSTSSSSTSTSTTTQQVGLYRVNSPWDGPTWTLASPGQEWEVPGGDYDAALELSEEAVDADGLHWFGSTRSTRDVVQSWIDRTEPNYGVLLAGLEDDDDEGDSYSSSSRSFSNVYHGRESLGHDYMPKMIVKYTAPSQGYPLRDSAYWRSITKYSSYSTKRRKEKHSTMFFSFAGGFATALLLVGIYTFVQQRSAGNRPKTVNTTKEVVSAVDIEVPPIH